jgi:hypothetical protein
LEAKNAAVPVPEASERSHEAPGNHIRSVRSEHAMRASSLAQTARTASSPNRWHFPRGEAVGEAGRHPRRISASPGMAMPKPDFPVGLRTQ